MKNSDVGNEKIETHGWCVSIYVKSSVAANKNEFACAEHSFDRFTK